MSVYLEPNSATTTPNMQPLNYIALAALTSQMHAYELVGVICQGLGETAIHFGNVVLNLVMVSVVIFSFTYLHYL